jgi:hypothetical protein
MLYGRKWKVTVTTFGGNVITLPTDLRVVFSLDRTIGRAYQFGSITIYNLSPATEQDILQNGKSVTLEAGYQDGPYGLIFDAKIVQPVRGKEDQTTYYIKLLCIDGDILNLGFCNFTLQAGQTLQQIAQQVGRSSTVPFDVRVDESLNQQTTLRAKTVTGKPGDALRNLAVNNNALLYADNGTVNLSALNQGPPASVPELDVTNGLIGMPQQVDQGVEVTSLINPDFKLNSWFHLDNKRVNQAELPIGSALGTASALVQPLLDLDGLYRIISMTIEGDTRGNDWYYNMQGIAQTGVLPAMLLDPTQTGL